jgi:hypothetical protein
MTPEDVAAKVFACVYRDCGSLVFEDEKAANIIRQAIADEREACAKVAEARTEDGRRYLLLHPELIAAAIRARGKE